MTHLRKEMEKRRDLEIQKIEAKKNARIKELTAAHDKKYKDIKNYYQEITNTNLDIIKQLKEELADAKRKDATKLKQLMDQEKDNKKVVQPLRQANDEVNELTRKKEEYTKIMDSLEVQKTSILG